MEKEPLPLERWLTPRNARLALLFVGLVSAAALFSLRNVRLDYDFEKFFPKNDPELDRYLAFRATTMTS
jgi:predicted RND superfamily exporter protein